MEDGYSRVTSSQLLAHLWEHHGIITANDTENNRNELSTPWNPDEPIDALWTRIKHVQQFAIYAGEALTEKAIIRLTLPCFESTGLFTHGVTTWRDVAETDWTLATYKAHFNKANRDRAYAVTIQSAGFHGANAATSSPTNRVVTTVPAPTLTIHPDTINFYWCWSHGLGKNPNHTSLTCNHPKEGHQTAATFSNPMSGNRNFANTRAPRQPPTPNV
jgi:hypothetical protein